MDRLCDSAVSAIVLHRAERLTEGGFSATLTSLLFCLGELVQKDDMIVVIVSAVPWPVFRRRLGVGVRVPVCITFLPYTVAEATEVVVGLMDVEHELLKGFVSSVVEVLYTSTTDVMELKYVSEVLFEGYLAEYEKCREGGGNAPLAAFNKVHARLGVMLRGLYRREYVSKEVLLERERVRKGREEDMARVGLSKSLVTLLVAAFLAAVNPPAQDVRYFTAERTKRGKGKGKGRGGKAKVEGRGEKGRGERGKTFPLERMLAIYDAIREENKGMGEGVAGAISTSHLMQTSTLVSLGYLSKEGGDMLVEPKFRCNVTPKQASGFANMAGIELDLYLHYDVGMT